MGRIFLSGLLVLLLPASVANATPGDLDPTFSKDGFATKAIEGQIRSEEIAVDGQDRPLVAAGVVAGWEAQVERLELVRYRRSGKPDRSFTWNPGSLPGLVEVERLGDLAIDAQGRIVLAIADEGDVLVARLLADGAPDSGFAGDGVARIDFGGPFDAPGALLIQPDGAILVGGAGGSDPELGGRFALARLTASGAPDPSFSGDGKELLDLPLAHAEVSALARAADGRIYAAGTVDGAGYFGERDATIARVAAGGGLDPSFGAGGWVSFDSGYDDVVRGIGFDAAGRVVFVSDRYPLTYYAGRLTTGGYLDSSLGDGGFLTGAGATRPAGFAVDDAGRAVVAGRTEYGRFGEPTDFVLNRFRGDLGGLDPGFADRGVMIGDYRKYADGAADLAIAGDGRIVIAGAAGSALLLARFEVASGPADRDGDGVTDDRDLCEQRYGTNRRGCNRFRRSLTITRRLRADLFKSLLRSNEPRCVRHARVEVRRVHRGPDRLLAEVRTGLKGGWRSDASLKPGDYYAFAPRSIDERLGFCARARSDGLRIR